MEAIAIVGIGIVVIYLLFPIDCYCDLTLYSVTDDIVIGVICCWYSIDVDIPSDTYLLLFSTLVVFIPFIDLSWYCVLLCWPGIYYSDWWWLYCCVDDITIVIVIIDIIWYGDTVFIWQYLLLFCCYHLFCIVMPIVTVLLEHLISFD